MKILNSLAILLMVLFFQYGFAQDIEKEELVYDSSFRLQVNYSAQFGEHSLAQSHEAKAGFGTSVKLFKYDNFRLYAGFDYANYRATDTRMMGLVKRSNYFSYYGMVSYALPVSKKFTIVPDVGIGKVYIFQKGDSHKRLGQQDGTEYRLGGTLDYGIDKTISFFFGAHYIYTKLDINTAPEYEDFFGKANQLQFSIGLNFK